MGGIILIVAIVCGSITLTVLGCVSMGTSYSEKKRGLRQGASQRDIETLHKQVTQVKDEIDALKTQLRELVQITKGISE